MDRPSIGSNSRTERLIATHTRVEQLLERDKRILKIKAHAERLRRQRLEKAWQPLFDGWIQAKTYPLVSCDTIAAWVSVATGLECQVADIYRRKRFLKRR